MARTKVDIITCDRCSRRLEEADVRAIQFSILYHDLRETEVLVETPTQTQVGHKPVPPPTRYVEVCKRCDTLLRKLAAQAAPPSKPGRKKEKEDDQEA